MRTCKRCGVEYIGPIDKLYCSKSCKTKYQNEQRSVSKNNKWITENPGVPIFMRRGKGYRPDLTGAVVGCWTVICRTNSDNHNNSRYECECKCGDKKIIHSRNIMRWIYKDKLKAGRCKCKNGSNIIIGNKYGHLEVIRQVDSIKYGKMRLSSSKRYECICECGDIVIKTSTALRKSIAPPCCGCFRREATKVRFYKHGASAGVEYKTLQGAMGRCHNINNRYWNNYGGRGITVCERWRCEGGYENFIKDMGPRPPGMSLDRIDNDKGYSPDNCRWASDKTQANNTRKRNYYKVAQIIENMISGGVSTEEIPNKIRELAASNYALEVSQ
jgi:hypothetical protein